MNDDLAKRIRASVHDFYEQNGAAFGRTRAIVWEEEKIVARQIPARSLVVDIGAGNGRFARLLPKEAHYLGFEPSVALRQSAPSSLDLRAGGFPKIPLETATADVVTCFAVIQHLPTQTERTAAIQELLRLAKPGALIAVTSWHPTPELTKQTIMPLPQGGPGDLLVSWKAESAETQRYIHDFSFEEWHVLWQRPELEQHHCGLFGRNNWTQDLNQGRNWFFIGKKRL